MEEFTFDDAKNLTIPELIKHPGFKARYAKMYKIGNPGSSMSGHDHFIHEIDFFRKLYMESADIRGCTAASVCATFMDIAYYGMTIEVMPKAQLYVRNKGNQMYLQVSPYGELFLRIKSGVIKGVLGPTLVYEGDDIKISSTMHNGNRIAHDQNLQSDVITGVWIGIILPAKDKEGNHIHDDKHFPIKQIMSYRDRSSNKGGVAWTGGVDGQPTRGMLEAKAMKHGLATYPRLNLGRSSVLQTEDEVTEVEAAYAATLAEMAGDGGSESQNSGSDGYSESIETVVQVEQPDHPEEVASTPEPPVVAKTKTKVEVVTKPKDPDRHVEAKKTDSNNEVPTFF